MRNIGLAQFPKIELHVHLDTSLSYQVLGSMCPGISANTYLKKYVAPARCAHLKDFLTYVDAGLELLQTENNLRLALRDLVRQFQEDTVIYAEVRLCPYLHTKACLSPDDVAAILCDELSLIRGDYPLVHVYFIFATLRHFSEEQSLDLAKLSIKYAEMGVVGFDLAGDEAGFPLEPHVAAFQLARSNGLGITVHAGEAKGPESVWEVLDLINPHRIGHGVRACEDLNLVQALKHKGTHLEVCVSSNIQTGMYLSVADHPIDFLFKEGVSIGLNTDGRGLTRTSLTAEIDQVQNVFGWGKEKVYQSQINAIRAAFCDEQLRNQLEQRLWNGYA
jgi:adenosine deaminase